MQACRFVVLAVMIVCLGALTLAQDGENRSSAGGDNTPARFELKKAANGQFFFNLKAANGQTILTSERYKTKQNAENGIASVRKNAAADARYLRKTAKNGRLYFVLTAPNHQVIGQSEMYESAAAVESGIASVKANARDAKVEDLT